MDELFRQQKLMHEIFASIMPDENTLATLREEQAKFAQIVSLHRELIEQIELLNAQIPSAEILRINELCERSRAILPDYPAGYTEAITAIEVYRNAQLFIPDALNFVGYNHDCMIEITKALAIENSSLIKDVIDTASTSKDIFSLLAEPVFSSSTHLHIAKSIGYYNIGFDEDTEVCYLESVGNRSTLAEKKIQGENEDWLRLLDGAKKSLCSRNPDKVRHAITSLRELVTQILHTRAPNKEVSKIYTHPKFYSKGNPTRRARITYILESKGSGLNLQGCIERDVSALLELFDLFQQGTHRVVPLLNDQELEFVVRRTELVVEQLL